MRNLRKVEVLEPLRDAEVERLGKSLPIIPIEKGMLLFGPSYRANVAFFLLEGSIRVYKQRGGWEFTLQIAREGEMLSNGVFGNAPSGAEDIIRFANYAEALQDSRVAIIRHEHFCKLIQEYPLLGAKATELLGKRLALYEERMVDLATMSTTERLASLLVDLIETEGVVCSEGFYKLPTRYTHEELASMIGCRRVALTRALTALKEHGVELRRRRIYVRDLEALRQVVY